MKKKVVLAVSIAMILVSSCSSRYASNGENLYQRSQNGPNLVIPSPLKTTNVSHFYDLPTVNSHVTVSIEPPVNIPKDE